MAEAGGGVNQNLWEYELTIDNEQLTIVVSLRDEFEMFFYLFPKKTP